MVNEFNKILRALDALCERVFDPTIIDIITKIASNPEFDGDDMEHFVGWAMDCKEQGITPTYEEWLKFIAPEKTGAPSPKRNNL